MIIFFMIHKNDLRRRPIPIYIAATIYPKRAPKSIKPTVPDNTIKKPNYISMRL